MAPSAKGKEKVIDDGKGSSGKRKRNYGVNGDDAGRKRRNRGVLQFFEDSAYEVDEDDASDDSFFDDANFLQDDFDTASAAMNFQYESSKAPFTPLVPKEEEPTEEELEKMLQERYKPGSAFVTYAEDSYESKRTVERPQYYPSVKDPIIWKVKCVMGRERHSAFCLMQKYVDMQFLGKKLQIISAFSLDHIKGFIYIEAEKQCDVNEACNGLCSIYSSRVAPVPKDDISHLFSVRNKGNGISEGMWARVKNGKYKGDLAQVAAVNYVRKKVTVKLVPRIDLQALAEKFGRGTTANRAVNPAPRLISSSELEEFRPLIQCRRDRDTNKVFEVLDGMMLKDGYLYKKVSIDSLSFWGVTPTDDERLKFEPSKNDECCDLEWLSQLYGERRKKRPLIGDKGGGKGEGPSSSSLDHDFEVHDLVFFGRKNFGVIIGTEKDESFKIIREGSEGPVVVTIAKRELKNASFDKKLFTALDHQTKNISINDTVRVLDGPMKDREGTVKRIYKGIIFLYNETVEENNGYTCFKAQMCQKVELPGVVCTEKGGEPGPSVFGDFASSPKSPLSPKQSDQGRDGSRNFNREDNAMFSVGQSLRIRVGPLKGYLCRVLAVRRSDVTVKLDSQHKILTVKCEHLAELRAKSSGISLGEDYDSVKPFDLLGTQDGSTDWLAGTAKAAEGGSWNVEGLSTERSAWTTCPASNSWGEPESSNPLKSAAEDANKLDQLGANAWNKATTSNEHPTKSWGTTRKDEEGAGGWGKHAETSSWNQSAGVTDGGSSWNKQDVEPSGNKQDVEPSGNKQGGDSSWSKADGGSSSWSKPDGGSSSWSKPDGGSSSWSKPDGGSSWNKQDVESSRNKQGGDSSWIKADGGSSSWSKPDGGSSSWSKPEGGSSSKPEGGSSSWSKPEGGSSSWSKPEGGSSAWSKPEGGSSAWSKPEGGPSSWSKPEGGSTWSKQSAGSSGNKQGGGSSWSNPDGGSSSWSKPDGGSSSWSKPDGGSSSWTKPDGGSSSWNRPEGGSTWTKQSAGSSGKNQDGGSSWSKPDGGSSSWSKPGGGSTSWSEHGGGSSWSKEVGVTENKADIDQGGSWGTRSKPDGGSSSWSKHSGGSSWSKEVDATENKGDIDQVGSWGRKEPYDGGRDSGGRRGRGGGRGGRGQFGRGRTFGRGETSNWAKGDMDDDGLRGATFKGNNSSWSNSGKADSWDKNTSSTGGKEDSWGMPNASGHNDGSKWNKGWGANKETGEWGGKSCIGWNDGQAKDQDGEKGLAGNETSDWQNKVNFNASKSSDGTWSSGWNKGSVSTEQKSGNKGQDDAWNKGGVSTTDQAPGWKKGSSDSGRPVDGGDSLERRETPVENSESPSKTSTTSLDGNHSSGWGSKSNCDTPKGSLDKMSSWGQKSDDSKMDVAADKVGAWNSQKTSDGGSTSSWGQSKWSGATDAGGGGLDKTSSWGQKSNDSKMDVEANKGGAWNSKWGGATDAGGGSSSGWGQSKWSGTDAGGKQNSWSSKSNWSSDNNFGSNEEQNDTFGNKGRGGNWRGSRGGRWGQDRGGFGGRGGFERGEFGGRGGSDRGGFRGRGRGRSDRGGFGGRCWSARGDVDGRGQSDREDSGDFGGRGGSSRGGFRGRGRGRRDDWGKNDSGEDKPYSWNNISNKEVDWKSNSGGSNWNDGVHDKGRWQSEGSGWGPGGGGDVAQAGGWNKGSNNGGGNDAQSSGWNHKESDWKAKDVASSDKPNSWKNGSSSNAEGWASNNSGANLKDGDKKQWQGAGSDWKKSKEPAEDGDIEQAGGWTKGVSLSIDVAGSDAKTSGWNSQSNNGKTSNSSGVATSSTWNQPAAGEGGDAGTADAWGKAASSAWAKAKDGNDKGGW